ncbi:unnamed protein product [Spirodela intermedia]|uniref:Uncharacterized protein n=1 Tax=Spirodela intermedia TaxID=51605 RepID=A0A7I8JQJ2_SPIIN|nr:unnamed protein product [Spirodela intermedia]CAA6672438.1 unnamed protein product [Spirodela intermedia]
MEDPNAASPIALSGADEAVLVPDSSSQIGTGQGSYQNEGLLSGTGGGAGGDGGSGTGGGNDAEFGFQRPEFGQGKLAGTVQMYERHLFLCYKQPEVWPSHVEAAEFDRLPRLLAAALTDPLDLVRGRDGTESSNGDVLIFPDMIRYRRLTHFDVDVFVEEVLVKNNEWFPGVVEPLTGSYVFVCAHGSRDKRCGVCGPELIKRFREEAKERGLQVSVSGCSHIGGHKYAGNVIIFSKGADGAVAGHWYGYVSPDDVPILLEQHIGRGEVIARLWRGQMGLTEDQQKKVQELRLHRTGLNGCSVGAGCCQGPGFSCGRDAAALEGKPTGNGTEEKYGGDGKAAATGKSSSARKLCAMPTWFERWEREDTYAALAVAAAAVSVVVAYSCYRQMR